MLLVGKTVSPFYNVFFGVEKVKKESQNIKKEIIYNNREKDKVILCNKYL